MPDDPFTMPRLRHIGLVCLISLLPPVAQAQRDRLTRAIDASRTSVLAGSRRPGLERQRDEGAVDPALRMSQISLMFKRSASQQAELDKLLADQQDPLSPNYHHWLQPEEFADRFGLSANDLARINIWLTSQGFQIDYIPRSRSWVVFSGTARQVQAAFATEIHHYRVDGVLHFANVSEISVPADLAGLVSGVLGLDDFEPKPLAHRLDTVPEYTSASGNHYLSPADYATIYDLSPLYAAEYNGTGQSIVIAGRCHIGLSDVQTFRTMMGLLPNDPQLILVSGSADPGNSNANDCGEAYLDVEWAGAVAPNATIIFVYGTSSLSAVVYAVDQNYAPIISFSFAGCETTAPPSLLDSIQSIAQQANSEGITWVAGSGDSGAAGCDTHGAPPPATHGLDAGAYGSVPEITGVGGTQFNEDNANYWNTSNSPTMGSVVSYIPEIAWNETAARGLLLSSGGGLSTHFQRPSWQTGPGITGFTNRGVPDLALSAAGHDAYLVYVSGRLGGYYGTSAATPSFAGMLAILNQYQVANHFQQRPGEGNINPNLYRLAQSVPSAFHDITSGDNVVPCTGTPDCINGFLGYSAVPGYDLVTGLGSVDANTLITQWSTTGAIITMSVTANPTSFDRSSSTQITSTLKTLAGSGVPTGNVVFAAGGTSLGGAPLMPVGTGAAATISVAGTQLMFGVNLITATYSGDTNFVPSSGTVTVTVTGTPSIDIADQRVTTQAPPPPNSACSVPPATSSFLTTDNTVYLYFEATVQMTDLLSRRWVGPGGAVISRSWNPTSGRYCFSAGLDIQNLPNSLLGSWQVQILDSGAVVATIPFTVSAPAISNSGPLYFIPVAPCHLVDTRTGRGTSGEFGPPFLSAAQTRTFHPGQGACPGIPTTAQAFSFNVTAAPHGVLSYMTLWPAGQAQPFVSTLNALKGGSVSNAAIVPAGANGGVSAFVTNDSDLMVDINGYFDTVVSPAATAFYALSPCRAVDTRWGAGTLGGPQMTANVRRDFPLAQSPCLPSGVTAQAYSLNVTVVPAEPLGTLTIWPGGDLPQPPLVSTVSATFADVTANANIALASATDESVNIAASNRTDVVLDLNGYFAAPGASGALLFQPVAPCRVADTRAAAGPFGGPLIGGGTSRTFVVPSSACNIPSSAKAYSLNVTVVPAGYLGYLSIWPDSQAQPVVSTLNSWDGRIVANAAIVPAGADGGVSVYAYNDTHVVIDINGYFVAP